MDAGGALQDVAMRLTRHAKNRIRSLSRLRPWLTERHVLKALESGSVVGVDSKKNALISVCIHGMCFSWWSWTRRMRPL
jgi:hypothetical protein